MLPTVYLNILLAIFTSFAFANYVIPSIIKIAEIKNLYDSPDGRKSHTRAIPNLGGIAIFGAFIISYCLFGNFYLSKEIKYILASLCFIFMLGAKDDIVELTPYKKFIGQIIAAVVIVCLGDIRLTSFYGFLGITQLPYIISVLFSVITIVFIINAFNLIDGVNWLAAGTTLVICTTFGIWFYIHGYIDYTIMSACIFGSLVAFLRYNFTPARIFMGDSGSLSLGLLSSVMAIVFIEDSAKVVHSSADLPFHVISAPALAIAIMIIPIFDTLRVFTLRISKGQSPFQADRNHHHHRLLELGFTHIQTTLILVTANIGFILLAYFLQELRTAILIPIIFGAAIICSFALFSIKVPEKKAVKRVEAKSKLEVENA